MEEKATYETICMNKERCLLCLHLVLVIGVSPGATVNLVGTRDGSWDCR
jgi:hypothetical protein